MVRTSAFVKRPPRIELYRYAVLITSDGAEIDVDVVDISSGGFRLEVGDNVRVNELVTLRVERGQEFPAQIKWVLGNEAGGQFLGPVADSALGG